MEIQAGWGVHHGAIMEWGPKSKRVWEIKPRFAKALRFRVNDEIVYAKKVTHTWTKDELRPHFAPVLERRWSGMVRRLNRAIEDA